MKNYYQIHIFNCESIYNSYEQEIWFLNKIITSFTSEKEALQYMRENQILEREQRSRIIEVVDLNG